MCPVGVSQSCFSPSPSFCPSYCPSPSSSPSSCPSPCPSPSSSYSPSPLPLPVPLPVPLTVPLPLSLPLPLTVPLPLTLHPISAPAGNISGHKASHISTELLCGHTHRNTRVCVLTPMCVFSTDSPVSLISSGSNAAECHFP